VAGSLQWYAKLFKKIVALLHPGAVPLLFLPDAHEAVSLLPNLSPLLFQSEALHSQPPSLLATFPPPFGGVSVPPLLFGLTLPAQPLAQISFNLARPVAGASRPSIRFRT
jgi:hypothetical protein